MSLMTSATLSRSTLPAFVVIGLCWGAVAATIPDLKARIGASDALFGALLLASAGGLLTAMTVSPWLDRRLGRLGLPCAMLGMALLVPCLGLAASPMAFALVLVGVGFVSGLTDVLANARVSEREAQHGRALMNVNHAAFSFAYAGSAVAAGFGREATLAPAVILALPAGLSVGLALLSQVAPADLSHSEAAPVPRSALFAVGLCGAIVLVGFMSEAAVEMWSALHVGRTLGGRAAEGALGPAVLGLTMGVGRLLGQIVAERWRDTTLIVCAALFAAVGALLAAAAPSPWVAYLGFGVAGLGLSVIAPLALAMAGRLVDPAQRTRAIAVAAGIGYSGFFLAPPLLGLISELGGLRMAFVAVALLLSLALPLVAALSRRGLV